MNHGSGIEICLGEAALNFQPLQTSMHFDVTMLDKMLLLRTSGGCPVKYKTISERLIAVSFQQHASNILNSIMKNISPFV